MEIMGMLLEKNKLKKIIGVLLRVEIYLFIVIIVIAILYYNYKGAHDYFNGGPKYMDIPWYHIKQFASLLTTCVFAISLFSVFFFPFVYLLQLGACFWLKIMNRTITKMLITIALLYFCCMFTTFLLYSIGLHRNVLMGNEINKSDMSGIKQTQGETIITYCINDVLVDKKTVQIFSDDSICKYYRISQSLHTTDYLNKNSKVVHKSYYQNGGIKAIVYNCELTDDLISEEIFYDCKGAIWQQKFCCDTIVIIDNNPIRCYERYVVYHENGDIKYTGYYGDVEGIKCAIGIR